MLLQLQHEHEPLSRVLPNKPDSIKQSPKQSPKSQKQFPPPEQPPPFFNTQLQNETSSFNFHIDGLEEIQRITEKQLPQSILEAIRQRKKFSEERIYEAIAHSSFDFVGIHMRDFKFGLKHELHNLFEGIHESVEAGIWDGRYEIGNRDNYFSINKKEAEIVAHIAEQLVKKNIENFRQELDQSEAASDLLNVSVSQRAHSEVEKAKKAEEFVRRMQEQQLRHSEFLSRRKEEKMQIQVRSVQQRKSKEEEMKRQKHELIMRRIARHREMASAQKEHKKKIQSEYLKFLSNQKKPLHKAMEEEYEKRLMEEQRAKFKKMKELMEERRPISFEEINQHMERYDELLYENQQFRRQKRELKQHEMEVIASKKPYRSKFYSIAVKGTPKDDYKELRTSLIKKQTDFAEHVKKNFLPKTDEKKQQELEDLVRRISHHKKHTYHSRKYIEEGKRNLQKLHLLIGQLRAKNKLKENVSVDDLIDQKPAKRYKNYLEEVKQSRVQRDPNEVTVDYDRKVNEKDHQLIKMQAMMKESKAKQQDLYLNSALETLDFDTHMRGKKMVEHDFIEAANAKLALLKKYQLKQAQTIDPTEIPQ